MLPIWPPAAKALFLISSSLRIPDPKRRRFLTVPPPRAWPAAPSPPQPTLPPRQAPEGRPDPCQHTIALSLRHFFATLHKVLLYRRKVVKTCPWHSLIKRNGTSAGDNCRLTAARVPASLSAWPPPALSSLHESGTNPSAADSAQGNRRASQRQRPQGSPSPTEQHGKSRELVVQ